MVAKRGGPFRVHAEQGSDVVPGEGFEFLIFGQGRGAGPRDDGERYEEDSHGSSFVVNRSVRVHEINTQFFFLSSIFSISSMARFIFFIARSKGSGVVMSIPAFFRSSIG